MLVICPEVRNLKITQKTIKMVFLFRNLRFHQLPDMGWYCTTSSPWVNQTNNSKEVTLRYIVFALLLLLLLLVEIWFREEIRIKQLWKYIRIFKHRKVLHLFYFFCLELFIDMLQSFLNHFDRILLPYFQCFVKVTHIAIGNLTVIVMISLI